MIFLGELVSFVPRAAAHSLGLGAEGKMRHALWDWWGRWARGASKPIDLHEYFMLHVKYHGPQMLPQSAGDVAAVICS